jgi:hypothetical protein
MKNWRAVEQRDAADEVLVREMARPSLLISVLCMR